MKNNLKKILSLVLVAVMCLSLVPFSVFADAASKDGAACQYCQGTNTKWKSYQKSTCSIEWSGDQYECQDCKTWTATSTKGSAAGYAALGLFTIVDAEAPAHVADLKLVKEGYAKTCTKDGVTDKFLCQNCNEYTGGNVIPAGHDWAAVEGKAPVGAEGWCTIVAPICGVRGGEYKRNCPTCGLYGEKTTDMVDHDWDYAGTKKAPVAVGVDCDEDNAAGSIKFFCKNTGCNEFTVVKVNDCDHVWSDYVIVKEAKCDAPGTKTRVCYGCGETEDEEITVAHTFAAGTAVAAVAGNCTTAGTIAYDTCTVCKNKIADGEIVTDITAKVTNPDGTASANNFVHQWGTMTYVPAQCGTNAYKVWKCTNALCGAIYKIVDADVEVQAHVVTLVYNAATVTCEADGKVAYYSCSACEKNFSDEAGLNVLADVSAKKIAHKNAYVVNRVEATCKDEGTKQHVYCPDCDQKYYDKSCEVVYPAADLVIAKPQGHTGEAKWYKVVATVKVETTVAAEEAVATCIPVTLYKLCSCCEYEYETRVIVNTVTGHNFINKTTELYQAENCVEGKYAWYYWDCEYCDAKKAVAETTFTHNFDGTIYRDAYAETCAQTIVRTIWCAVEGCTATTTVDAGIGAHDVEFVAAKAATCTENGYVAHYNCKICGAKFFDADCTSPINTVADFVNGAFKLNHELAATPFYTKAATGCTTFGYKLYACIRCDYVEANALEVLGHSQVIVGKQDATCDADGWYEYSYCDRVIDATKNPVVKCNATIVVAKKVINATGHKNEAGQKLTYDCNDAANAAIADRVCVNPWCNDADKTIELRHNLVPTAGVGNCVEDKYTADQCSICNKLFNQSIEAGSKNPANHKAADTAHPKTLKKDNSDCQEAGTIVYTCGWCKGDIVENVAAQNKNHTSITHGTGSAKKVLPIDNMTVAQKELAARYFNVEVVPMTPTSVGYTRYTCKWCDYYKDVDIQNPYTIWFSFDYNSANVNAADSVVVNGGMVEVKIYAEALNKLATNIQATFNYDPTVLTFVGAEGADIFDQAIITGKNGLVTIYAFNDDITNSTINGKMLFVTLKFKVATLDGETELGYNAAQKFITTVLDNFAADASVANPDVDNEGQVLVCKINDLAGNTNDNTIDIHKLGAITSDNWVTGLDHVALFKLIATKGIEDGKLVAEADLDMDGDVDVDDYIFLAQYLGNKLSYAELVEIVNRPAVEA